MAHRYQCHGLEANAAAARLMLSDISLSIELTDKTEFIQWITTKKKLSGTIKIEDANNPGSNLRTIKFSDAYICSFNESFSGGGGGGSQAFPLLVLPLISMVLNMMYAKENNR